MLPLLRLALVGCVLGCVGPVGQTYLTTEASFFRAGVDRKAEEREVRRVFAQRKLDVVSEVRTGDFTALGAESAGGNVTAVRVITGRGVVVAEDAVLDDLFRPARVKLLDDFAPALQDLVLVATQRTLGHGDEGCANLWRILPTGGVAEVVLDVTRFGTRACVVSLAHAGRDRLQGEIGFPGLSAGQMPRLPVALAFQTVPLGRPDPAVRGARPVENSESLGREQKRLHAIPCLAAPFEARQALGVARAALSHFVGKQREQQLAAYRECVGEAGADARASDTIADTLRHIENGWLDAVHDAASTRAVDPPGVSENPGDQVITPDDHGPAK